MIKVIIHFYGRENALIRLENNWVWYLGDIVKGTRERAIRENCQLRQISGTSLRARIVLSAISLIAYSWRARKWRICSVWAVAKNANDPSVWPFATYTNWHETAKWARARGESEFYTPGEALCGALSITACKTYTGPFSCHTTSLHTHQAFTQTHETPWLACMQRHSCQISFSAVTAPFFLYPFSDLETLHCAIFCIKF